MGTKAIFFLTTLLFLFTLNLSIVTAQETSIPTPTPVEYQLPYPGILPGHPFYFLKTIRNNVMSFLISNPLRKAEFYLLQSDKNLQAAVYLSEQGKNNDVIKSLQESENNFSKSIEEAKKAIAQGIYVVDFAAKITIANFKHREVVSNLLKSAKSEYKQKLETELKKIKDLGEKVKELDSK